MAMIMTQEKQDNSSSADYAALCSDCQSFVIIGEHMLGRWIRCPYCGLHFKVERVYQRRTSNA